MPARHPHSIPLGGFLASTGLDLAPFLSGAKWGAIVGRPASRAAPARVRYLTQVIWGPGYRVAVEPVTGEADARPPEEIACWEAGLLVVARCWFAGIRPGDDAAIRHSHRKDIKEALIG